MAQETTIDVVENTSPPVAAPVDADAPKTKVDGKEPDATQDKTVELSDDDKAKAATEAAKLLNERKQSARERVQQAVARQRDAERQSSALRNEVAELRAKLKEPDPNLYDDNAKYTADTLAHQLDQREVDRTEKQIAQADASRQRAIGESWRERVSDFKQDVPDFDDVVYVKLNSAISETTALMIAEMDDGPQVAYNLGKNPSEARRIEGLSDRAKAFELGKLAGKLTAPVPRKVSAAPNPIDSVSGNRSSKTGTFANLSQADYAKQVAKEMRG